MHQEFTRDRGQLRNFRYRRQILKAVVVAPVAIAFEGNRMFSSYPSSPASAEGLSEDPISTTLLDCSGTGAVGYADPDSVALKRLAPSQEAKIVGYVEPGIGVPINNVIKTSHVEGYPRHWTEVIEDDAKSFDSKKSSYVLTTSADLAADGAIRANIDFDDCDKLTP